VGGREVKFDKQQKWFFTAILIAFGVILLVIVL
jgi:hypothetical protein